jgi:NDP-hexose 4-ketoreductase
MTDLFRTCFVTGADGRIGAALRASWGPSGAFWMSRGEGPWRDLMAGPLSPLPPTAVLLHLATDRRDAARALRLDKAVACALRDRPPAHVFFASSAAVYGDAPQPWSEAACPSPVTAYGKAKRDAEDSFRDALPAGRLTILRIGNVFGADALGAAMARPGRVLLDPVDAGTAGPLRSWIGPVMLASVLRRLVAQAGAGRPLPGILNLAQPGPLGMGTLLDAAGRDWTFGPPRAGTCASAVLATDRLLGLLPVQAATPDQLVAEWRDSRPVAGLAA